MRGTGTHGLGSGRRDWRNAVSTCCHTRPLLSHMNMKGGSAQAHVSHLLAGEEVSLMLRDIQLEHCRWLSRGKLLGTLELRMTCCPLLKWHVLFCAAEIGSKIDLEGELGADTG